MLKDMMLEIEEHTTLWLAADRLAAACPDTRDASTVAAEDCGLAIEPKPVKLLRPATRVTIQH